MKSNLKRIFTVVIAVVMALSAVPLGNLIGLDLGFVSSAAEITVVDKGNCGKLLYYDDEKPTFGSNAKFTLYSNGKLVISGKGEFGGFEHPDNGYYYVPYARYELIDSKNDYYADITVKSVVIDKGITSIGQCAFRDFLALESIVIPSGITSIGYKAFWGCENLKSISIPNGVTSIGDGAFYWCASLEEIKIPTSVTSIKFGVFWGCKSLTHITIPDGITSISASSFYDCDNLKKITIPASVKAIKSNAFYGCTSLEYIFYTGTEQQLNLIVVDPKGNACIDYAVVHYNHKHNYKSKVIKAPTCCTKGEAEMICVCGEHYSKSIPTTGEYAPKTKTTKATLSANGKIVTYCNNCKKVRKTTNISKISSIKLSATKYTYNGKNQSPTVIVKDSAGKTLRKNVDYTVSAPSVRKNPGKYAVKVTFKGNYSGTKTLYFTIAPATPTLTVTAGAKKATLKWNAQTGATGYVVYASTSKTGKYTKIATVKGGTSVSYTKTGLTTGKTYYFRVAAYTTSGGSTIYGSYSSVKSVKVK